MNAALVQALDEEGTCQRLLDLGSVIPDKAARSPDTPARLMSAISRSIRCSCWIRVLVRRTFDAVCRLAGVKRNILIESRAPSNLLALAEAGHGVAVIPSVVLTHRYTLRVLRVTHACKPIREPLGVTWGKRRPLPRYARSFCEMLAAHMRELAPIAVASAPMRRANRKHINAGRTSRPGSQF